jgi:putative tryptophan/tyrosine transport system substrate-binding protein
MTPSVAPRASPAMWPERWWPLRVITLLAGLLAGTVAAQPVKVHRVGYLIVASSEEQRHLTDAFEDAMRELGYVEGRNVVYLRRFADGKPERLAALAAELAAMKPDVIVTGANPVIDAVRAATTSIPVVMTTGRDVVRAGYVASYARPGGNITGLVTDPSPEAIGKGLEAFLEIVPRAKRVALLWNPVPSGAATYRSAAEAAAARSGITLHVVELRSREALEQAFAGMARERVDGVWVLPDPLAYTGRATVVRLTGQHRLPSVFWQREFVDQGGLVSYGSNVAQNFRRTASYVDRILKGARPGDLAVEQPSRFELVVNAKTAALLGLAIPPSLLQRADVVVR